MPAQLRHRRQAWLVLIASTLAFTVCFMVWMMFGVISIPIGRVLQLNATQVGLMMALPSSPARWCACRWACGPTAAMGAG